MARYRSTQAPFLPSQKLNEGMREFALNDIVSLQNGTRKWKTKSAKTIRLMIGKFVVWQKLYQKFKNFNISTSFLKVKQFAKIEEKGTFKVLRNFFKAESILTGRKSQRFSIENKNLSSWIFLKIVYKVYYCLTRFYRFKHSACCDSYYSWVWFCFVFIMVMIVILRKKQSDQNVDCSGYF